MLTGTYDAETGDFNLGVNTSDPAQCGYMYEAELCDDAIDCRFEACQNTTSITGQIQDKGTKLEAESSWYYMVTISYQSGEFRGYTVYECEGNATLDGAHH